MDRVGTALVCVSRPKEAVFFMLVFGSNDFHLMFGNCDGYGSALVGARVRALTCWWH